MFFDLSKLWSNFSTQAYILLAFVGAIIVIVGILTQGVGKAVGAGFTILIIAGLLAVFDNLESIGNWLRDTFIKVGYAPSVGNYKEYVLSIVKNSRLI